MKILTALATGVVTGVVIGVAWAVGMYLMDKDAGEDW